MLIDAELQMKQSMIQQYPLVLGISCRNFRQSLTPRADYYTGMGPRRILKRGVPGSSRSI